MGLKFSNFGKAIVASAPSGTAGLSFTVEAGKGLLFPSLGAGDYFYGILKDASGNREIVKVEARNTDSLTISADGRGLDGTAARTWAAGDYFVAGLTSIALQESLSNANLIALGALTTAADKVAYWTGAGAAALSPITSFIRGLFAANDAAAARTTLGAAGLTGDEIISGNKTFADVSTFSGVVDLSGTVLKGAAPLALDGATPGGSKTSISVVDPTANRTITLPDADVDLTKVRAASTTLDGVLRIGTNAEQLAGSLSNVACTPAGLAASQSLATNGYRTHPGGGLEQWAQYAANFDIPAGGQTFTVTFPIAFPTQVYSIVAVPYSNDTGTTRAIYISLVTLTTTQATFHAFEGGGGNIQVNWGIYYRVNGK